MPEKLARVFRVFQNCNLIKKEESKIKLSEFNHKNQDIKKIVLSSIKKKYQKNSRTAIRSKKDGISEKNRDCQELL